MGIVDKSLVQPVLDAIIEMRSSPRELAVFYEIVDVFCARWLGKPRSQMSLEDEETIYLAHELLREYLRFEGNNKRVALWLLTINRCCRNYTADLSGPGENFSLAVSGSDLDFDRTLLGPILQKADLFESRHSTAVSQEMGADDAMGSFYQWIGAYCTYVYPKLQEEAAGGGPVQHADKAMVSTLAFLISEFISLKENVSRVAAIFLALKEACALGQPAGGQQALPAPAPTEGMVAAGTEADLVGQILEKLRAESRTGTEAEAAIAAELADEPGEDPAARAREAQAAILDAASDIRAAEPGSLARAAGDLMKWAAAESGKSPDAFRRAVGALVEKESVRAREAVGKIAAGLSARPKEYCKKLEEKMGAAGEDGRKLLSRLIAIAAAQTAVS